MHFFDLRDKGQWPSIVELLFRRLFRFLVAGHEAVTLFFVLSGFVLTLPYLRPKSPRYGPFLVKRICRIYLPYLGGLGFAIAADASFHGKIPSLSTWFQTMWSQPMTWHVVLPPASLIGFFDVSQLNVAFWSLVIEMRMSIIFPLLMVLLSKVRKPKSMFAIGAVAIVFGLFPLPFSSGMVSNLTTTLQTGMAFVIGSLLARSHESCSMSYLRFPKIARVALWVGVLGVWSFGGALLTWKPNLLGTYDMILTLTSGLIIVISMSEPWVRDVLLHKFVQYLGHVSYSVYLLHVTVLLSLVHVFYGRIPLVVLLPVYFVASFAIATVFNASIEMPSAKMGTWLSKRV
jgi:peptidoglycan/LPS O-acetylase OafA/YrhL